MYLHAQKPQDTWVQKFNEKSKQHFKLAYGYFHCQKLKPMPKNVFKSAKSLILTFSLPILPHYQNHRNAPALKFPQHLRICHMLFSYGYAYIRFNSSCQHCVQIVVQLNQLHSYKQLQWKSMFAHNSVESLHFCVPSRTSRCIDRHLCCVVNQCFATGWDLLDLCSICSCLCLFLLYHTSNLADFSTRIREGRMRQIG